MQRLQIQSHEALIDEFLHRIPMVGPARTCPEYDNDSCNACVHRTARMSIYISHLGREIGYWICDRCHVRGKKHALLNAHTPNAYPHALPLPDVHYDNMKHTAYTNVIKMSILRLLPNTYYYINVQCSCCILNAASDIDDPDGLCEGCRDATAIMSDRIRSTIVAWSCARLPNDCRMMILDLYVSVLCMSSTDNALNWILQSLPSACVHI